MDTTDAMGVRFPVLPLLDVAMNSRLFVFAVIISVSACASYESIRELEPIKVERFTGAPQPMGSCVVDTLRLKYDAAWDFTVANLDAEKSTRIGARFRNLIGGSTPAFSWELALRQVDDRAVDAEVRSIRTVWGTPQYPDDIWDFIRRCSSG